MGVLPFADGVHASSLANKAKHGGILMPNIAHFYLYDLSQRIMHKLILQEAKDGQFSYELFTYGVG
jgi:hypothetical protein